MNSTNINSYMFTSHLVLNLSMIRRNTGTILNITSITGLEAPPFPGKPCTTPTKRARRSLRMR